MHIKARKTIVLRAFFIKYPKKPNVILLTMALLYIIFITFIRSMQFFHTGGCRLP